MGGRYEKTLSIETLMTFTLHFEESDISNRPLPNSSGIDSTLRHHK